MTTDGDSLTVEEGGSIFEAADFAVEISGAGVGVVIENFGYIQGAPAAIRVLGGADIEGLTNTDDIFGGDFAVQIDNGNLYNLVNSGFMAGLNADSIFVANGNIVDAFNRVGGGIVGQINAIQVTNGDILGLDNAGSLTGQNGSGILVTGGGIFDLNNSGAISGETSAITADSIDGLSNLAGGQITGLGINSIGISVTGPGGLVNLTNGQGASITGGDSGIDAGNTYIAYMVNSGMIAGGTTGIVTTDNISMFENTATGVIQGDTTGIEAVGTVSYFVNHGRITGVASYGLSVIGGGLFLSSNELGGVIFGGNYGLSLDAANLSGFTNAGLIAGATDFGVTVSDGNLLDFTNEVTGVIIGGSFGIWIDLAGFYQVANLVNAGRITGNSGSGISIANGDLDGLTNLATGVIEGSTRGVLVSGNLIDFTNAGVVAAETSAAGLVAGVQAGELTNLVNTGSIMVTNTGGGTGEAVRAVTITSLTNSGRIFSELGVGDYAIRENGAGGNTDLTLLPGSVIQGMIDIEGGGAGANNLFVGQGLNLATTFETDLPDSIETYGALWTANPATGLVSVADTSALAAEDNAFSNTMRGVSGVLAHQLQSERVGPERTWWIDGTGGLSVVNGGGAVNSITNTHAGLVTGFDTELGNGMRGGLFGGLAAGSLASDVENGATLGTKSFFLGGYNRYTAGRWYADVNLTGGIGTNAFERLVANNLVLGGLETSSGSFTSWFLSPEITIGSNEGFTSREIRPSATIRYGYLHSAGFTETGLTAGELSAGARTQHILDLRLQAAMPVAIGDSNTRIEARAGVDGRLTMGGSFDAALGGIAVGEFSPGGEEFAAGAFVGADLMRPLGGNRSFYASTELGFGSDTAFRADIRAGVRGVF
jgi:hypothetical protein